MIGLNGMVQFKLGKITYPPNSHSVGLPSECLALIAACLKSASVTFSTGFPKSWPKTFCVHCSSFSLVVACQRYKQLNWKNRDKPRYTSPTQWLALLTSILHTLPRPLSNREWSAFRISCDHVNLYSHDQIGIVGGLTSNGVRLQLIPSLTKPRIVEK